MSTTVSTTLSREAGPLLDAMRAAGAIEAIDVQLATTLLRRSGLESAAALATSLATALTSRAKREGHSAITLSQLAEQAAEFVDEPTSWWREQLGPSSIVGLPDSKTPLVRIDELLQFRRYFDAERRIASRIHELLAQPEVDGVPGFSIVTGGPGTGKTTHVARRLLDLTRSSPSLRIALAAPTGKAAARLTESISLRLAEMAAQSRSQPDDPGEARTLHRLLAYSPATDRYRRNHEEPLDDDVIIVDEASMVDVLMLDALLRAIKPGARLMLVGDHYQLASVDAGDVLGALCRSAAAAAPESALRRCMTVLTRSWRFEQQPAIGALALAMLGGDHEQVLRVCRDDSFPNVQLREHPGRTEDLLEPLVAHLERSLAATSPAEMLSALEQFRVLAPEREGRLGVMGLNRAVERWLTRRGHPVHDVWYHGRPVLVTANDYTTNVFNGDLGVVWRESGSVSVYFRTSDGSVRAIAPVRLPTVETAWAMTVHKSQGSEFDDVLIVLPERESRVLNRELLYTAVTRARQRVILTGSESAVAGAVGRSTGRTSGLADRLALA